MIRYYNFYEKEFANFQGPVTEILIPNSYRKYKKEVIYIRFGRLHKDYSINRTEVDITKYYASDSELLYNMSNSLDYEMRNLAFNLIKNELCKEATD